MKSETRFGVKLASNFSVWLSLRAVFYFLVTVVLVSLSLVYWDQPLSYFFQDESFRMLREVSVYLTDLGLGWPYFVLSSGGYLFCYFRLKTLDDNPAGPGEAARLKSLQWWSSFAFSALLLIGAVIQLFKFALGRQRPHMSATFAPDVFFPATFNWDFHSFPSGHSQVIFVVATVLALWQPRFRYFFFGCAALIAFTRVVLLQHFFSDIIVGAAIGYFGTQLWYRVYSAKLRFSP